MKPVQWLGAGNLVLVIAIVLALVLNAGTPGPELTVVRGHIGNLKLPFFADERVQRILKEKYGLVVEVEGMATQEMLCPSDSSTLDGVDFLFPGEMSQVASYEECQGRSDPYKAVFLSPMVIYS